MYQVRRAFGRDEWLCRTPSVSRRATYRRGSLPTDMRVRSESRRSSLATIFSPAVSPSSRRPSAARHGHRPNAHRRRRGWPALRRGQAHAHPHHDGSRDKSVAPRPGRCRRPCRKPGRGSRRYRHRGGASAAHRRAGLLVPARVELSTGRSDAARDQVPPARTQVRDLESDHHPPQPVRDRRTADIGVGPARRGCLVVAGRVDPADVVPTVSCTSRSALAADGIA